MSDPRTFEAKPGMPEQQQPMDYDIALKKYSFKLTKNTKGFNYEFKVNDDDMEKMKEDVLKLNKWAQENFGGMNQ